MKPPIYMSALLMFFSMSVAANDPGPCDQTYLTVQNATRGARICNQVEDAPPMALLLAFHGRAGNGRDMAIGTELHEAMSDAVVVYLDGLIGNPGTYPDSSTKTGWNIHVDLDDVNQPDVVFVDAVIDAVSQRYNIDMSRIYAVGHSNGAQFLRVLWLMRADTFAGFAFSAAQADGMITFATPKPVFMGMGLTDDLALFEWQSSSIGYAAERFGITEEISYEEGTRLYQNEDGIQLMTYIHPYDHIWPDDQTEKIVDFFNQQ